MTDRILKAIDKVGDEILKLNNEEFNRQMEKHKNGDLSKILNYINQNDQ